MLVDSGLFPEAGYDPIPALEQLGQPVLALWGEHDRAIPPAESLTLYAEVLERGATDSFTLLILPDADHAGYHAPEGESSTQGWITSEGRFAAGYIESMTRWIHQLADAPPPPSVDTPPTQTTTSTPLPALAWYESAVVHLGTVVIMLAGFAGYPSGVVVQKLRGRRQVLPIDRPARWVAGAGLVTVLGWLAYFGLLLVTVEATLGPVVLGRTLPWIVLQLCGVAVVVAAVVTGAVWWRHRHTLRGRLRAQHHVLLVSTATFVPWAVYWGLLVP